MNMESIEQALRDAFVNAGFEHAVDGFIQNLKDEVEREQGRGPGVYILAKTLN